ncbi:MAG: hypothetical protein ACXVKA_09830 [Acidimicrobiia bacterium]
MSMHTFVLARRVGRAPGLAERALPELVSGEYAGLSFRGPFERRTVVGPWGSGPAEREAQADLRTGRRSRERVAVALGPWAHHAVELRIRPANRRPDRWSGRRQLRYFDHAHEAIDELARALERATPAPVASRPITRTA